MTSPELNPVHLLRAVVDEVADDTDALSDIGADLATALVGNEPMTQVVTSALVCALANPAVSEATSQAAVRRIGASVEVSRAMLSAEGQA